MATENIWSAALNQDPYLAYQAFSDQWGTGKQRGYYEKAFQDVHSQFLSQVAEMMRQGVAPTAKVTDWLQDYDWEGQWQALSPMKAGRGQDWRRFAPPLDWQL